MINANNATAEQFERAAQRHANAFWIWLVIALGLWWVSSAWWAAIPGFFAILKVFMSVDSTRAAGKLRAGTYETWNPNNGAPDGLASNWDKERERKRLRMENLNKEWDDTVAELKREERQGGDNGPI